MPTHKDGVADKDQSPRLYMFLYRTRKSKKHLSSHSRKVKKQQDS